MFSFILFSWHLAWCLVSRFICLGKERWMWPKNLQRGYGVFWGTKYYAGSVVQGVCSVWVQEDVVANLGHTVPRDGWSWISDWSLHLQYLFHWLWDIPSFFGASPEKGEWILPAYWIERDCIGLCRKNWKAIPLFLGGMMSNRLLMWKETLMRTDMGPRHSTISWIVSTGRQTSLLVPGDAGMWYWVWSVVGAGLGLCST